MTSIENVGACDEQCRVVGRRSRDQRIDDGVADLIERSPGLRKSLAEPVQAYVDIPFTRFNETVGIEREKGTLRQFQLGGFERQRSKAERRAGRQIGKRGGAIRPDEDRW